MPFCTATLTAQKPKDSAYPEQLVTLGDHLKKRFWDLGIQQKQAARLIGVAEGSLLKWVKGHGAPSLRCWPMVMQFLGYDPRPPAVELGRQLRLHREIRAWSRVEAAKMLGINESVLWRWESGQRKPQGRHLAKVYRFLGDDPRPAPVTIGARLKRRREQLGFTLTAMAARLRVAQSTLCRWESGEREPGGRFLEIVAKTLIGEL